MTDPRSRREEALKLALEARNEIFKDISSVSSILRKCLTICCLLEREDEHEWIKLELNGYFDKYETVGDLEKGMLQYRKVILFYFDEYKGPILVNDKSSFIQDFSLGEPITELERSVEKGLFLYGGRISFLRRKLKAPFFSAQVSPLNVQRVVDTVKNMALEFLNRIILELEYGNILYGPEDKNLSDVPC